MRVVDFVVVVVITKCSEILSFAIELEWGADSETDSMVAMLDTFAV